MGDLQPGKYWSYSLSTDLDEDNFGCLRRVFYRVFGSWKGWQGDRATEEQRILYMAKTSMTLRQYVGVETHKAIRGILLWEKADQPYAEEARLLDKLERNIRAGIEYSYRGEWSKCYNPKDADCILAEHFAGGDVTPEEIEEAIALARLCLSNFLGSLDFWVREAGEWILVEAQLDLTLNDFKIFIIPDLIIAMNDHEHAILDWKTGRRTDLDQLKIYAWGWQQCNTKELVLHGSCIPLRDPYGVETIDINEEHHRAAKRAIERDISTLTSLQADGLALRREAFPRTTATWKCNNCTYRFYCEQDA